MLTVCIAAAAALMQASSVDNDPALRFLLRFCVFALICASGSSADIGSTLYPAQLCSALL